MPPSGVYRNNIGRAWDRFKAMTGMSRSAQVRVAIDRAAHAALEAWKVSTIAGNDRNGRPLHPVQPKSRKGVYRGASGAPLTPFGRGSRAILGARVDVLQHTDVYEMLIQVVDVKGRPFVTRVRSGFQPKRPLAAFRKGTSKTPSFADVLRWHAAGRAGKSPIVRDILGLTPKIVADTNAMVADALRGKP